VSLIKRIGVLSFLLLTAQPFYAQTKTPAEFQVKAAFLFNFTRFIEWPETAFSSSGAPFVIGIIGKDPYGAYLDEIVKGEKIADHPIIIKHFSKISEIQNCQILFISATESLRMKEILSTVSGRSILSVGDTDNFVKSGGIVRLFTEQNRIRLEINNESVKASGLSISSKLLSVARIY
jgi:hypothetical protein